MILLECPETGERCLVESTDGYESWHVLSEDTPPPPPGSWWHWVEHERRWRSDPAKRLRDENRAAIVDPEMLLTIIEDLTARVAALEAKEN